MGTYDKNENLITSRNVSKTAKKKSIASSAVPTLSRFDGELGLNE